MELVSDKATQANLLSPLTTGNSTPHEGCLQIRRALWALFNIDDREAWQVDLISALLEQDTEDANYDALADARLEGMVEGLNLFFRFFEVRADLSFRHQAVRFDDAGFLRLSGPWSYTDDWWDTVPQSNIKLAETILVNAGILEFQEIDTGRASVSDHIVTCIRLRADLIFEVLKNFEPSKYNALNYQPLLPLHL
jgi:hypothetical protein